MISHYITQHECACYIIVIVFDRFYNRFSYCLESCKMNNRFDVFFFIENFIHCLFVADVCFIEFHGFACDFFHSSQSFFRRVI